MIGDALPLDDELASQAGGCEDTGTGGNAPGSGCMAGATGLLLPANAPAPTGTGAGVTGMAGILPG